MKIICVLLFVLFTITLSWGKDCKKSNSKLFCYYSNTTTITTIQANANDYCKCTHYIFPSSSSSSIDPKSLDKLKEQLKGVKIFLTINEFNQDLVALLKSDRIDGVEVDLEKLDTKDDIADFISTIRSKLGGNLQVALSIPAKAEILAKFYDFKALTKTTDYFILQTAFLGASKNFTFHPSRLSGLWDMQNIDSVVDLVNGLGAPLSKLVITSPVQAFKFKLQEKTYTAPGSPALEIQSIDRNNLCELMKNGNWTLERDQDQTGPYIFSDDQWIAFDDEMSIDIKAKYARVRGLAGMALKDLSQDGGKMCDEKSLLDAAASGLNRQSRAPRGAVLQSLERGILADSPRLLDTIQVSPYRISRIIDVEGNIHVIRQDTRTEFHCSRQGYFVHPRSCNRFYRCVKFDQLSDEFSVFEFDCPAGLAFDETVEVCVWPGSLKNGVACSGSSEIAPVPQQRFICPGEQGYYADPENCRWFFACLDHGKSPLSAYEFRCPFGLAYDESRLMCEWPWLVARCASGYTTGGKVTISQSLDQYNGLGVLGRIPLGGFIGPLPQVHVYTNVGSGGVFINGLSQKSVQSLQNAGLLRDNTDGKGLNLNVGVQNINVQQGGDNFAKSHQSITQYHQGGVYTAGGVRLDGNTAYEINSGLSDIEKSFQYGQKTNEQSSGIAGNINIIGGGYSAVSGVEVVNNGEQSNFINNITPSPISIASLSSIPTVTSIPLPNLKTAHAFESYKGGVVANVPQLQYRVTTPKSLEFNGVERQQAISYHQSQNIGLNQNIEVKSQNVQSIETKSQNNGYHYTKPVVSFEEVPLKSVHPIQPVSVLYQQPKTIYSYQNLVKNINGYSQIPTSLTRIDLIQHQQPVQEVPFVQKTAYVTGQNYQHNQQFGVKTNYKSISNIQSVVNTTPNPVTYVQSAVNTIKEKSAISSTYSFTGTGGISSTATPQIQITNEAYQPSVTPVEVSNYNYISSTPKSINVEGYTYPKPTVQFSEEPQPVQPITITTPKPTQQILIEQPKVVQPSVVSSYDYRLTSNKATQERVNTNFEGYNYPKPSVQFTAKPIQTVQPYQIQPISIQQPIVVDQPEPVVTSYSYSTKAQRNDDLTTKNIKETTYVQQPIQPAVVSTYNYISTTPKSVEFQGYNYDKPSIQLIEQPRAVQPVVTNYHYANFNSSTKSSADIQGYHYVEQPRTISEFQGYDYPKPSVQFIEQPKPVVASYSFSVSTPKPVTTQQAVIPAQPISFEQPKPYQPAVLSSYSFVTTPKPLQPVEIQQFLPVEQPKAFISSYSYNTAQRNDQQFATKQDITVEAIEQPKITQPPVISSYSFTGTTPKPIQIQQSNYVQPAVSSYSFTTDFKEDNKGYTYTKPSVQFIEEPQPVQPIAITTPKPTQQILIDQPKVVQPAVVSSYDYRLTSNKATQERVNTNFEGYNYPKPSVQFVEQPQPIEEIPFVSKKAYTTGQNYQYNQKYQQEQQKYEQEQQYYPETKRVYYQQPKIIENYQAPSYGKSVDVSKSYYTYNTTPKPTFESTISTILSARNQPTERFYYYDSRLSTPTSTTVTPIATVTTTSRPIAQYEFGSVISKATPTTYTLQPPTEQVVVTKYYLPPATPTKAYLTPTTTVRPVTGKYLPPATEYPSTIKKVKVLKAIRPKTIVKTNDFHPLLSAKLGAQCTCISNTLSLKKKPQRLRIEVPDEYINEGVTINEDENSKETIIENYQYEPQKIEVSTRLSTSSPLIEDDEPPSDKEIVKAVKTGLKLIKAAAKDGAREGTVEVLSGKFDRYGPGGVRSRNEILQGTVDCQRAGLFRHPTQCNKFYSCRWDCTKNRYTLHVFNCPVHLTFDNSLGACNWPSQGPACTENTLLPSV